jgi:hypothetical protein
VRTSFSLISRVTILCVVTDTRQHFYGLLSAPQTRTIRTFSPFSIVSLLIQATHMVYHLHNYPAYDFTLLVADRHSLGVQFITRL